MPHGAALAQIETVDTGGRKRRPAVKCTVTVIPVIQAVKLELRTASHNLGELR